MLQAGELLDDGRDRAGFFVGITPVEIEPGLDARREKQRAAGFTTYAVLGPTQQLRGTRDDLATCMPQQIDRVLDAPSAFERAGVHRDPQRLRQLLGIERLGLIGELAASLEESAIEISGYQALAKVEQGTLGEHRLGGAKAVEHHLPAQIEQRQLHRSRIRRARVRLQQ